MEDNTEEAIDKTNGEKRVPRGLDQVSHLFLSSHAQPIPRNNTASPASLTGPAVLTAAPLPQRDQLLSLLRQQTGALEQGMKLMDSDIPCEIGGNIELLGLDAVNQLTVIEVQDKSDDNLLLRGLGHVDWIARSMMPFVRRMYQGQVINAHLLPRLFLVAPEFSPLLTAAVRQAPSVDIRCMKYHAVGLPGGPGIFFEQL